MFRECSTDKAMSLAQFAEAVLERLRRADIHTFRAQLRALRMTDAERLVATKVPCARARPRHAHIKSTNQSNCPRLAAARRWRSCPRTSSRTRAAASRACASSGGGGPRSRLR